MSGDAAFANHHGNSPDQIVYVAKTNTDNAALSVYAHLRGSAKIRNGNGQIRYWMPKAGAKKFIVRSATPIIDGSGTGRFQ
jgi:hypothetical protein